jgi:hypothetical protein
MHVIGLLGAAARSGGGADDDEFVAVRQRLHEARSAARQAMKSDVG